MKKIPHVNIIGSENADEHTGIVTFTIDNVHPHDISEILAADGIDRKSRSPLCTAAAYAFGT
ncbi:Aminotransferase, class V/Cysteine desulfurase [human gut metagenome]|uniref:Aminotransferase, class V/Cysteine desulfurase n=1 Tax=human gut metagenome TaxID=408170 RepID=K1T5G8_9ZZZZ